jgi:hypothetical protein
MVIVTPLTATGAHAARVLGADDGNRTRILSLGS